MSKERLDNLLVARGLAPSRARAQAIILAGKVEVDGMAARKAGDRFHADAAIVLREDDHPYVSRGALKLVKGLDSFAIDPTDLVALDIGALEQHLLRRRGEPRGEAAAADATAQAIIGVHRQRREVERLLGAVVEHDHRRVAVPAQRDRAQVGVVDVDVRVAHVVHPHDGAAVVEDVEPAQDRALEAGVGDLVVLVPQPTV